MRNLVKILFLFVFSVVLFSNPLNIEAFSPAKEESELNKAIQTGNWVNAAIHSKNLAEYYDNNKNYSLAAKYYVDSANYWKNTPNPEWGISLELRAAQISTDIELYVEKNIELGYPLAKYEPQSGTYLGIYAAGKKESPDKGEDDYYSRIENIYGRNHAIYLTYTNWTQYELNFPTLHAERVKSEGSALQIALQPMYGLDQVQDSEAIRKFARQAKEADMPIFIRFAGEMNDAGSFWYDPTGQKYVEKFRLVHDIFEEEAPNVAMVWAPNFLPYDGIEKYYPGDKYVDWIGLSLYMDPVRDGKEIIGETPFIYLKEFTERFPNKPFMYAEGAVSHYNYLLWKDYTAWANSQLAYKYAYASKMFPQLKAITYFNYDMMEADLDHLSKHNNYDIGDNASFLNTYKRVIQDDFFIDTLTTESNPNNHTTEFEKVEKLREAAGVHNTITYVKLPLGAVPHYVAAYQGTKKVADSYSMPFALKIDFSKLDMTMPLQVKAYDSNWQVVASKDFPLNYKKVRELSYFTDVDATHWAFDSIMTAAEEGILNGYLGKFSPNAPIKVQDFNKILANSYGQNEQIEKYAYPKGVTAFMKEMNFPYDNVGESNITRTQVAETIAASQGYNLEGDDAIKYLLVNGLSKGKDPKNISVENYDGKATLSRAEAVTFIANIKAVGASEISARPASPSEVAEIRAQYKQMFE